MKNKNELYNAIVLSRNAQQAFLVDLDDSGMILESIPLNRQESSKLVRDFQLMSAVCTLDESGSHKPQPWINKTPIGYAIGGDSK